MGFIACFLCDIDKGIIDNEVYDRCLDGGEGGDPRDQMQLPRVRTHFH